MTHPRPQHPIWLLAPLLLICSCDDAPLAFKGLHIKVAHDGFEVLDAHPLDLDHDGDMDLIVATENDLRYLRHERLHWRDESGGTGLPGLAPARRLLRRDNDFVVLRDGSTTRLAYSGIGSWEERARDATERTDASAEDSGDGDGHPDQQTIRGIVTSTGEPPVVFADLDGDGIEDKAWAQGQLIHLALGDDSGKLHDVTRLLGADALRLPSIARRLHAVDIEGDGDLDLLIVAGRIFALLNNGGAAPPLTAIESGNGSDGATPQQPYDSSRAGDSDSTHDTDARDDASHSRDMGRSDDSERSGKPWFRDGTAEAGLACVHHEGDEQWDIRPTMGPGAAFADIDGDGDADLFVVGGADQDSRLFANDGSGRFHDVSAAWGITGIRRAGMGALFADWDDDGDPDLYMTCQGPNVLLRHDGDHFTDVSASSGTDDPRWGASANCADIDRDGDLDLFVTNYLEFDLETIPPESRRASQRREDPIAMLPYVFSGQGNVLYRNDSGRDFLERNDQAHGNGTSVDTTRAGTVTSGKGLRFTDVTAAAGLLNPDGKSLGAAFFDQDLDGWPDLTVANDTTPNTFFHNLGDGTFEELSLFVGLDDPRGGMGLALADIDADGDEDIALTNWQLEPNALYRNNRVHGETARRFMPAFEDIAVPAGLAQAAVGRVGWGCVFADFDGDGDDDLFVANGYTSPDYETTMTCVGQPDQLFENVSGPGPFASQRELPHWKLLDAVSAGAPFEQTWASRAAAAADIDGDGDLDLVVTANNGPLLLLLNEARVRSLRVVPAGRPPGTNRDAIGARVTVQLSDGRSALAVVHGSSGYLGQNERGVRFTLGDAEVLSLTIDWPDGSHSTHPTDGPGVLRIEQPVP